MFVKDQLAFDPSDPAFLEDPYPVLNRVRESARVFYDERRDRWFVTRHEDVRACLRDRRLGRNFRHVMSPAEIGVPELDPRWPAFWATERWSLLWLEPPDHTRIRKLVAAAFTPRSVEALREPARTLAHELLERLAAAGRMELLYDYAQPYSIAVISRMLGVPRDRHRDLLEWSHRMVRMYEFDVPVEAAEAANRAAAEFQEYVRELIAERRAHPQDDMVSALVGARETITRGAKIAMLFGAANRDPRVFERPDTFDVGRENAAQHIGFGGGIHVCIGAPLARIELEASLAALRRHWPDFGLVEEPRRTGAFVIWGLEGLRLARG